MDRRQISGNVPPPISMRPNSFIPTSANQHSGNGKLGQVQIQQLALQSQLQAQSHSFNQLPQSINMSHSHNSNQQQQHSANNYYQNVSSHHQGPPPPISNHHQAPPPSISNHHQAPPPSVSNHHQAPPPSVSNHHQAPPSSISNHHQALAPSTSHHHQPPPPSVSSHHQSLPLSIPNQNRFSHGTLPRHSVIAEQQLYNHQSQQLQSRTLTKSYSSHYGNTTLNQQQIQNNGGNPLYGNLMGPGANGRHHSSSHGTLPHAPPPPLPLQHQPHRGHHHDHVPVISNLPPPIQPVINQIQQQHHSNKILQHYPSTVGEGDGLPPTLVESMRTLFDILDDTKEGRIRLSDIESRWENNESSGPNKGNTGAEPLIKMGVMGYLRKVTPPDGMLTFDRFCSGLRLALVTNNNNPSALSQSYMSNNTTISQPLHVKNVTNNFYSSVNSTSNNLQCQNQRPTTLPISNSTNNNNNSVSQSQNIPLNTGQRTSRIPGLSVNSKLPMVNNTTGIPVSPKNKFSTNLSSYNSSQNSSGMGTAKRIPLIQSQNAEQGTTVAIVHQPPPPIPNPKPIGNTLPIGFTNQSNEVEIKFTKPSLITPPNGGFTKNNRHSSKNGSLDNLKSDNEEKVVKVSGKLRPPSAPILDTTDDDDGGEYYDNHNNTTTKRERAKSRDRDIDETNKTRSTNGINNRRGKSPAQELSFGKRVVSFVTPRQRTLSMPQLQLGKLKPNNNKSTILLDDDSSPSASSSSHSPLSSGEPKQGALKSSLKAHITTAGQGSSIPTKMAKQKSDVLSNDNNININGDDQLIGNGTNGMPLSFKENRIESPSDKEISAPPKPPRNNNSLIVSVSLGLPTTSDSPMSGSSTTSTNNPSKPEIRQCLQSWKNGVAEKRADDTKVPEDIKDTENQTDETQLTETNTGSTVKLRGDKKGNARRREAARRHTVQSGIDFATLKRLKQLEQERDLLQQGTNCLQNAQEWYNKQLETVDDKITLLTKGAPLADNWSESLEERLNLLGCRISEVNGLLVVLMDGSARIPNHMNLQIPSHLSLRTITRLKEQNRQLTQEVSDCSHRVTQLETEKAMLLRQLFHQKNTTNHSEETVYM